MPLLQPQINFIQYADVTEGPDFVTDELGLPKQFPGIKQPQSILRKIKFLQKLSPQQQNLLLIRDLVFGFNPIPYKVTFLVKPPPPIIPNQFDYLIPQPYPPPVQNLTLHQTPLLLPPGSPARNPQPHPPTTSTTLLSKAARPATPRSRTKTVGALSHDKTNQTGTLASAAALVQTTIRISCRTSQKVCSHRHQAKNAQVICLMSKLKSHNSTILSLSLLLIFSALTTTCMAQPILPNLEHIIAFEEVRNMASSWLTFMR